MVSLGNVGTEETVHANCASPPRKEPVTLNDILESKGAVASLIDHTLLKPEAAQGEITRLCDEARELGFASVCINPYWVRVAAERLKGTSVHVCTVVGFPLGANDPRTKLTE